MSDTGQTHDDLIPPITRRPLPPEVAENRLQQVASDEAHRLRYEKVIDAHISAHGVALNFLDQTHDWIADNLDFDLVGDTRPAAVWQMSGRCIGIGRLILDALSMGYCSEVMHLTRALHEADRLVGIFLLPEEAPLLRKWLADEGKAWVRPKEAHAAEARFEERLAQAMREAGVPELRMTKELTKQIYGHQSEGAHHRRRWTQDAVSPALRSMIRGPTSHWKRRAGMAESLLAVVEGSVITVGDALGFLVGPGWYEQAVKPLLAGLAALRAARAPAVSRIARSTRRETGLGSAGTTVAHDA